jgi:hypothetical protein
MSGNCSPGKATQMTSYDDQHGIGRKTLERDELYRRR